MNFLTQDPNFFDKAVRTLSNLILWLDQKRNKGWWRGSRERIEMEAQKVTELTIEEEDKEHLHLPLLVSSRCVSSEFPTRFCSKALQQ